MYTLRSFLSHKFTIRQSVLVIGVSIAVAFAAHVASEAAGLSGSNVTAAGVAAAAATFLPMLVVFYRRAHA